MILSLVLMALMQQSTHTECIKSDAFGNCSVWMRTEKDGVLLSGPGLQSFSSGDSVATPEPMDVPAIERKQQLGGSNMYKSRWTCSDKRRVLLTAENGDKHCVLFQP